MRPPAEAGDLRRIEFGGWSDGRGHVWFASWAEGLAIAQRWNTAVTFGPGYSMIGDE